MKIGEEICAVIYIVLSILTHPLSILGYIFGGGAITIHLYLKLKLKLKPWEDDKIKLNPAFKNLQNPEYEVLMSTFEIPFHSWHWVGGGRKVGVKHCQQLSTISKIIRIVRIVKKVKIVFIWNSLSQSAMGGRWEEGGVKRGEVTKEDITHQLQMSSSSSIVHRVTITSIKMFFFPDIIQGELIRTNRHTFQRKTLLTNTKWPALQIPCSSIPHSLRLLCSRVYGACFTWPPPPTFMLKT